MNEHAAVYPQAIFEFVMGMNRWIFRIAAHATLMTDACPPFRLDMRGHESATDSAAADAIRPQPAHWVMQLKQFADGDTFVVVASDAGRDLPLMALVPAPPTTPRRAADRS